MPEQLQFHNDTISGSLVKEENHTSEKIHHVSPVFHRLLHTAEYRNRKLITFFLAGSRGLRLAATPVRG
ncbi:MAG: hypothetical protein M0Q92_09000 [Methanoregula sp.]|jgi:hypothetical protein|nr:hypothetical protein [Methanoregula sp.]